MLIFGVLTYIITMRKHYIISNLIITLILVGLTLVTFTFYNNSSVVTSGGEQPLYKGRSDTQSVALMINVYWGTEHLDSMLNTLDKYSAKCTFFFGGSWVNCNPAMLEKIYSKGHEIANHGYFHKDQDKLNLDKNKEEIIMCEKIINAHIDVKTKLFAPPSGAFNKTTMKAAKELGYEVIMWSKDTIDWRDKDADLVYTRATKNIQAGDFVLMHPTAHTAVALSKILQTYKDLGLKADIVSNMI